MSKKAITIKSLEKYIEKVDKVCVKNIAYRNALHDYMFRLSSGTTPTGRFPKNPPGIPPPKFDV